MVLVTMETASCFTVAGAEEEEGSGGGTQRGELGEEGVQCSVLLHECLSGSGDLWNADRNS